MQRSALTRRTGAHELRPASHTALAVGAFAVGAVAFGALAIGALSIARLSIGRARFRKLHVDELSIGRIFLLRPAPTSASTEKVRPES